jgi:hypothetical protein
LLFVRLLLSSGYFELFPISRLPDYTVQPNRFDIFETSGCQPTVGDANIYSIILIYIPPLLFSCLTFAFGGSSFFLRRRISTSETSAVLTSFHLFRRWSRFVRYLADFNPALRTSGFIRLVIIVVIMMTTGVLFTSLILRLYVSPGVLPYRGWAYLHDNFPNIRQVMSSEIPPRIGHWRYFIWWMVPISGFCVFICFSFTEEVGKDYIMAFSWFCRSVLRRQIEEPKPRLPRLYVDL